MIVDPSQKLDSKEKHILPGSLGILSENISNEVISKMVSTHLLKRWNEMNTQLNSSFISNNPLEHIYFIPCSIILK